jgi:hypothetical protein
MDYYIAGGVCWKENTCVRCGSAYPYMFSRRGKAGSASEARSSVRAELDMGVAFVPCPGWGHVQPDMHGARPSRAHGREVGTLPLASRF